MYLLLRVCWFKGEGFRLRWTGVQTALGEHLNAGASAARYWAVLG